MSEHKYGNGIFIPRYVFYIIAVVGIAAIIINAISTGTTTSTDTGGTTPVPTAIPTPVPTTAKPTPTPTVTVTPPATSVIETRIYTPINRDNQREISLSDLPEKIYLGSYYIKDFKLEGEYFYGYLGSDTKSPKAYMTMDFLDKDGAPIAMPDTIIELRNLDIRTKKYEFDPVQSNYKISFADGKEKYFRIKKPAKASFLRWLL